MNSDKNCQNRREAIAAFVLGELGAKGADELKKHIDACETCRSLYQTLLDEEEMIQSAFKAIGDRSEIIQDSLVERSDKHPAALEEDMRPRRSSVILKAIMKSRLPKLAAAAVIIIAVLIGIYHGGGGIESVALGEVFENMRKMPWMHQISTGFERGVTGRTEQWANFESNVWMFKGHDGKVCYWDIGRKERYSYDPASNTIKVSRLKGGTPLDLSSPVAMLESMTEKLTEWGAEIVAKSGKYKGKAVAVQEISLTQNNISSKLRLFIHPKQHLLLGAEIKGTDPAGNVVMDGNVEFEYPENGPKDIYALGVPANAKVVVEGMELDIQLAGELKRVEAMFAARDVDGLMAMLSDAKFEDAKVLAANYLAEIGDSRAIEPLEKLSADWSGDEQDNPYAAAIQEINERLEQETTTETLVKDSEDLTEEKSVTSLIPAVGITGSGSIYDHFVFTRRNGPERQEETRTLVLAKVTAAGFELRDIDTRPRYERPGYPWQRPVCMADGTLYCANNHRLEWINLVTGETGRIENLPSLTDEGIWWGACYDNGRLYAQAGERNRMLQVLDFRMGAYRDITALEHELEYTPVAVSPDHEHLAYFVEDPNGNLLTVVNVASGQVTHPIEPIRFVIPGESSLSWYAPPLIWVDANRVVFIRTEVSSRDADDATNKVAVVDVSSGEMEDIVALPGNPYGSFMRMTQRQEQAGLRIWIDRFGEFSIDLAARKLIEDETVLGDYLVSDGYLFYGEQELGSVQWDGRKDMEISPDGKRAIWASEGKLFYHDSAGQTLVPIIEDGNAVGGPLWLKAEDLKAPIVAPVLPAGWIAFKDRPPEAEEDDDDDDDSRVARKDIKDHLVLTLETDKDTYVLHEPIELTLTLTSTTDANIQIESSRMLRFDMDCNDGSKDIECAVGPYEPNVEAIVLRPGESISATDTLEIALAGDYKIRCEYGRFEDPWRGEVKGEVAFRVNPVGSPDEQRQLFQAKFSRLTAKLRRELSTGSYDWSWVNALVRDEVVGMAGMGPNVAPYITEALKVEESEDVRVRLCQVLKPLAGPEHLPFLTEALKTEESGNVRESLYRILTPLAGPEYLPFFQDRLAHGAEDESGPACGWLYDLYRKGQDGSTEALATLLSAMNHENAAVRRVVAEHLKGIYDPNIEGCFQIAIDDEDEEVRTIAASYLAAAECLDLDEWLDVAAKKPTKARYLAAKSIVKQLEQAWNITKGDLPNVSWEEASKDPEQLEQYRKVVQAWQKWASENLRFSSQFFNRDREGWLKNQSP